MKIYSGLLIFASCCANAVSAQAMPSLTTLTPYEGGTDGASPYSRPVRDSAGVLYSTAYAGGANGLGTVFSLTPPASPGGRWTKTVIYTFRGGSDGAKPLGNLMLRSGNLFGTTYQGGGSANCDGGCGTAFRLTRPSTEVGAWKETVLYRFGKTLYLPQVGLVADASGALFGVARAAYPNHQTVYKLVRPAIGGTWTASAVFTWTQADGYDYPNSGLLIDAAGNLYGTTYQGGAHKGGSVYSLTPPASAGGAWTKQNLYSFSGEDDGLRPYGLASDRAGNLYGVTAWDGPRGHGTVYRLERPATPGGTWTKSTLYDFPDFSSNGAHPLGELAVRSNNAVFGMTTDGGLGYGTVFKLTPPASPGGAWAAKTMWKFSGGTDGGNTYDGVSIDHTFGGMSPDPAGGSFGTTSDSIDNDYPNAGFGSVFKITP